MDLRFKEVKKTLKQHTLHAFYSWASENGFTPMVYVVNSGNCMAPPALLKSQNFWLNLHPEAIRSYEETADGIFFIARFSGNPFKVYLDWQSVIGFKVAENNDFSAHLIDYPEEVKTTKSETVVAEQSLLATPIQAKKTVFKPVVLSGGKVN
jgi:stringent starvation protein B